MKSIFMKKNHHILRMVISSEFFSKLFLCDNGNAQLMGLLVFRTLRLCIIIYKVCCAFTHTTSYLTTLTFYISLQFVSVFIMIHIACYHKSLTCTFRTHFRNFYLFDIKFLQ